MASQQSIAPPSVRGHFYPSIHYRRCPQYHHCRRCHQCLNFNIHNQACTRCESRKSMGGGRFAHCSCTREEVNALIQLEAKMGRPAWDKNLDMTQDTRIENLVTNHDPENQQLVEEFQASLNGDLDDPSSAPQYDEEDACPP